MDARIEQIIDDCLNKVFDAPATVPVDVIWGTSPQLELVTNARTWTGSAVGEAVVYAGRTSNTIVETPF